MGKIINAIGNTWAIIPRTAGTAVLTGIDTAKTVANVLTDAGSTIATTKDKLWEVLSSSRNTGKRYNKLYQVPASVGIGAGVLVEGAVRTVLEPTRNAFLNVRDTAGNFFVNIGNTLKRTFKNDRPVSDFRFEKMQMRKPTGENYVSKRAWWNKTSTPSASSSSAAPSPTPSTPSPSTPNAAAAAASTAPLLAQITALKDQMRDMQNDFNALKAENQNLINVNQQLLAANQRLAQENATLQSQIAAMQAAAQNPQTAAQSSQTTGQRGQTNNAQTGQANAPRNRQNSSQNQQTAMQNGQNAPQNAGASAPQSWSQPNQAPQQNP